jgi:replicative DNA helicase
MQPAMDALEQQHGHGAGNPLPGVPTGLIDLDQLTGGLVPGDLWVLTGRSGVGKSMLGLDFLRSAAFRHNVHAALAQGRDKPSDAVLRLLSAQARVGLHHLQTVGITDDDWARLARTMGEIAEAPLWIDASHDFEGRAPTAAVQLQAAQRLTSAHDLRLVVIDDLPAATTVEQLRELKSLAAERQTCVLAVITDGPERSREAVENNAELAADVIVRLDRDHDMTPGSNHERAGEADLLVLRHRRGPISCITVAFQGHYARFVDIRTT